MRTILFISVLLTVFGTGCGGCADEDKNNSGGSGLTNSPAPGSKSPAGIRKQSLVGRVDLSTLDDAGATEQ